MRLSFHASKFTLHTPHIHTFLEWINCLQSSWNYHIMHAHCALEHLKLMAKQWKTWILRIYVIEWKVFSKNKQQQHLACAKSTTQKRSTYTLHITFEIITITGPIEACVFVNAYNPVQSHERYKSVQFNSIRSNPSVCASVRLSETVVWNAKCELWIVNCVHNQ